jgi:hypothetical protein
MSATKRDSAYGGPWSKPFGDQETQPSKPQDVRIQIGFCWGRSVLIPVQFAEIDEKRKTLVL